MSQMITIAVKSTLFYSK